MSNKTITIKRDPIVVTFDRWFGIYGQNYKTKDDAIKVWEQIIKKGGRVWHYEFNGDDDDAILQDVYFDPVIEDAEMAVLPDNYHDEEEEAQPQMCSASSAETLPTKNS